MSLKNQSLKVSVIIPTVEYNQNLQRILDSLLKQTFVFEEIIVVAKSAAVPVVDGFLGEGNVKVFVKPEMNKSAACNFGSRMAVGEVLVFLDDDCVPADENWLSCLVEPFCSDMQVEVVSGRITVPGSSLTKAFIRQMNGLGTPDYGIVDFCFKDQFKAFPATNLAVKKFVYQSLGGFDSQMQIAEDVDFYIKLHEKNVTVTYASKAVVHHLHVDSLAGLLKHSWKTGRGSSGFIRKHGFCNKYLPGTSLSVFCIPIFLVSAALVFLAVAGVVNPLLLLVFPVPYVALSGKYWCSSQGLNSLIFPFLFLLYSLSLGLGVFASLGSR